MVVGTDIRHSSESLKLALSQGLMDGGVDIIDIGMTGTEEIYFTTFHLDVDGGIEVTPSHNLLDYNGMKLVKRGARPISGDTALHEIQRLAELNQFKLVKSRGSLVKKDILPDFIAHLTTYVAFAKLKPLKLVVNSGNGAAGHVIDTLEIFFKSHHIPVTFVKVHHEANGDFPNGIPNPLLPENRHTN